MSANEKDRPVATGPIPDPSVPPHEDHPTCWECQAAAYNAGFDHGEMHANRVAAEALAQELLSAQAAEMAGFARREAETKGPAWRDLLEDEDGAA